MDYVAAQVLDHIAEERPRRIPPRVDPRDHMSDHQLKSHFRFSREHLGRLETILRYYTYILPRKIRYPFPFCRCNFPTKFTIHFLCFASILVAYYVCTNIIYV